MAEAETGVDRQLDATDDELHQALREALGLVEDTDPNTHTVAELAKLLNVSEQTARKSVRDAIKAGTMERKPTRRRRSDGRLYTVPGVRLVVKDD